MDITKARRVIKLTKEDSDREILVTVWDNDRLSSCVVEDEKRQSCQSCDANDELCQEWLGYLQGKGYTASEIELEEAEPDESLPKFMERREVISKSEMFEEEE